MTFRCRTYFHSPALLRLTTSYIMPYPRTLCVTTPLQFFSSNSSSNHLNIPRAHVCVLIRRRYFRGSRHNASLFPLTFNLSASCTFAYTNIGRQKCQTNLNLSATCAASALLRRLFRNLVLSSSRCHSFIKHKTKQSSLSDSGVSGNVQTCRGHFGLEETPRISSLSSSFVLYSFLLGAR